VLELGAGKVAGEHVEEQADVGRDFLVTGQQGEVGVDAGCLGIVIARAEVGVTA
jgi:hypothetical protein